MATTITAAQIASHEIALAAATEDTVVISASKLGNGFNNADSTITVTVIAGTSPVYMVWGATPVTVKAQNAAWAQVGSPRVLNIPGGAATLRLISAAIATVTVERGNRNS